MAEKPLTIADIAFRCGLVYNTVKRVVLSEPLVKHYPGYPARYEVSKPSQLDPDVLTVRYNKPDEGWEAWLDSIRPLLVSITALSDTMTSEELARKVSMFEALGRSFLSLAKDLEAQNAEA